MPIRAAVSPAGAGPPAVPAAVPAGVDTSGLAGGRYGVMETLLEKTIFKVDVLTLTLRVDPATASRLGELVTGAGPRSAREDSAVAAILRAPDVLAEIRFKRTVSLGQFLGGVRDDMKKALAAGIISRGRFEAVSDSLPVWFSFLGDRKAREGDTVFYRMDPDSMRTVYVGRDGEVLLDLLQPDPRARLGVLGSYLAPGSDFRDGLLRSLFGG